MKQNEMNSQKAQELTKEEFYHCYIDVSVNSQRTGPASSSKGAEGPGTSAP